MTMGLTLSNRGRAKDVPLLGEHFLASYWLWVTDPKLQRRYWKTSI